jgi:hypothetical protein
LDDNIFDKTIDFMKVVTSKIFIRTYDFNKTIDFMKVMKSKIFIRTYDFDKTIDFMKVLISKIIWMIIYLIKLLIL